MPGHAPVAKTGRVGARSDGGRLRVASVSCNATRTASRHRTRATSPTSARRTALTDANENDYHSRMSQQPPLATPRADAIETPNEHSADVRRVASHELLRGAGEIVIEHRGREYRLRITQHGKLILTA